MMNTIKRAPLLLFLSFFISSIHCGDIALINALNKGRFYQIKSAIKNGADPNCTIAGDPALVFAIKRLVEEIQKETVSIPQEVKRFIVGTLLLTPAATEIVLGAAGMQAVGMQYDTPHVAAAIAILAVVCTFVTLLCVAMGVVGGVKVCRAAWRVFLTKPFQVARRRVNIFCRRKVIDNLLSEDQLNVRAQNSDGKTAFDVVREYSVDDALVPAMEHIEGMLIAK